MPPIKCPSCEYRNSHTADICINCGASLSSPAPVVETQRLDPAQMREHLAAKNLSAPSSERMSKPKAAPPQETQRLNPAQMREHPAAKNKPIPNSERMPKPNSAPRPEVRQLDSTPMREHPAAKNKPIPNSERTSKPNSAPRPEVRRLDSTPMREHPAAKNKPIPNSERTSKPKAAPPQETQRLNPAQMREHLAAKNKPIPNSEHIPDNPIPNKERNISKNRPHSKAETVETYAEASIEMQPEEVESYAETEVVDPHSPIEPYSEDKSYSKEIVPYYQNQSESAALVPSMNINTALEPYGISSMIQQLQPQGILPTLPTFVKEEKDPEPWLTEKLPWGFPRRSPDVAGKIILITQSQELPDYPNVILGLVNMLTELIWMIPNDTMKKEEERLQVTIARIRINKEGKDELKDVRLIGYLRGANLTLGDTVWFWGWHRKGSLLVRKGYNWTSRAIVETHSMGLILPALVVLILLGIAFLVFLIWPSLSSGLGYLFQLAPHKP